MIKDTRQDITTVNYDTVAFQINNEDGHLFAVLSELYSRPIDSCIREVCTNCNDAHIMSGNESRPFVIKLPNYEKKINELSIRDFGPGLKHEQIMDIYRIYGKSTKNNENKSTGCLGLGSKSPYAVTSVFYVRSYLNGKIYLYTCSMDNNNIPNISEKPIIMDTDEENGLEVIIPIHKEVNFVEILKRELKHFTVKPIVYKKMGEVSDDIKVDIDWIKLNNRYQLTENISLDSRLNNIRSFFNNIDVRNIKDSPEVVQLQIYYPIESDMIISAIERFNKLYYDLDNNVIIKNFMISDFRIKIIKYLLKNGVRLNSIPGKIAFSPSRESIKYTEKTLIYIIQELNKAARIIEKKILSPLKVLNSKEDYFDTFIMNNYIVDILNSKFNINFEQIIKLVGQNKLDEYRNYYMNGSVQSLYGYINMPISSNNKSFDYNIVSNYKDFPKIKNDTVLKNTANSGKIIPLDLFDPDRIKKIQNNNRTGYIFEFVDLKMEFLEDVKKILNNFEYSIRIYIIERLQEIITKAAEAYKIGEFRLSDFNDVLRRFDGEEFFVPVNKSNLIGDVLPQNRELIPSREISKRFVSNLISTRLHKYDFKDHTGIKKLVKINLDEVIQTYKFINSIIETFNFSDKKNNLNNMTFFANCINKVSTNYKKKISPDYIKSENFIDKLNLEIFDSSNGFYSTKEDVKNKLKLNKFKSGEQWIIAELLYSLIHESVNLDTQYQIFKLDKFEVYKKRIEELRIPTKYLLIEKAKEIHHSKTAREVTRKIDYDVNMIVKCDAYLMEWDESYVDYIDYLLTLSKIIYKNVIKCYLNLNLVYRRQIQTNPSSNQKILENFSNETFYKFIEDFKTLTDEFSVYNYNNLFSFVYRNFSKIGIVGYNNGNNTLYKKFQNLIDTNNMSISFVTENEEDEYTEIKLYRFFSGEEDLEKSHFYRGTNNKYRDDCDITIGMWYNNYDRLKERGYTPVEFNQITNPTAKDYESYLKLPEDTTFILETKNFHSGLGKKLSEHISKVKIRSYIENFINQFTNDSKKYLFMEYPKEILTKEIKKERINGTWLILKKFTEIDIQIIDFGNNKTNNNLSTLTKLFCLNPDINGNEIKIGKHIISNYYPDTNLNNINTPFLSNIESKKVIVHFLYTKANESIIFDIVSNFIDVGYKFAGEKSKENILKYYRYLLLEYRKFFDTNLKFMGLNEIPTLEEFLKMDTNTDLDFNNFVLIFNQIKNYTRNLKTKIFAQDIIRTVPDELDYFKSNLLSTSKHSSYEKVKSVVDDLKNYEKFGFYETRKLPEQRILQICKILEKGNYKKLDTILENGINSKINVRTIKDIKNNPHRYPKNYKIRMNKNKK